MPSQKNSSEAKIFISYSRKNRETAHRVSETLRDRGFEVFRDTDDILPTEEWRGRLEQLINEADTIVFLLSPQSASSDVCQWEVELAHSLNKRIAPIVIEDVDAGDIPPLLARLNFIFATPRDPFQNAVDTLVSALNTDIGWIREHTRLAGLAKRWDQADRPPRFLLRGQDIVDAEKWRDGRPPDAPSVTQFQAVLISESRSAASRRQRLLIGGSLTAAFFAIGLSVFAFFAQKRAVAQEEIAIQERDRAEEQTEIAEAQRELAEKNEQLARQQEALAEKQAALAEAQRDIAQAERNAALTTQSRFLADLANQSVRAGRPSHAMLLSLEGLPDETLGVSGTALTSRPIVNQSFAPLREALRTLPSSDLLLGQSNYVWSASFDNDSRYLVTAAGDGTAKVWDLLDNTEAFSLRGDANHMFSAEFSPNGRYILTDTYFDAKSRLWDVETAKQIAVFESNKYPIGAPSFSRSGDHVLTITRNDVIVWDVADGSRRQTLPVSGPGLRSINSAVFSPDAQQVLTAAGDKAIVWDVESGREVTVATHEAGLANIAYFDPLGRTFVTGSNDFAARIWNAQNGELMAVLEGHKDYIQAIAFDPQGRFFATASDDGTGRVWDLASGQNLYVLNGHKDALTDVVFSPDGRFVATASKDGTSRIWSGETGGLVAVLDGHTDQVSDVAFSPDGRKIATTSLDDTVRVWDATRLQARSLLEGHPRTNLALYVDENRRLAFVTGEADDGRIIDLSTNAITFLLGHAGPVIRGYFSPDGQRLLTIAQDNTGRIWDTVTGQESLVLDATEDLQSGSFNSDGRLVAIGSVDGTVRVWNSETGELTNTLETGIAAQSLQFNQDDTLLLTANAQVAAVWDVENGAQLMDTTAATDGVVAAFLSSDGATLLLKLEADIAYLMDVNTGEVAHTIGDYSSGEASHRTQQASLAPNGRLAVTSSWSDGTARIWDVETGQVTLILEGHQDRVSWSEFSPDSRFVVTASGDGSSRVWDAQTGEEVALFFVHADGLRKAVFSADGKFVLTTARDWSVQLWPLVATDVQELVNAAKESAIRCLTQKEREEAFLPLDPPRWCITGPGFEADPMPENWRPLPPYEIVGWRDWLVARDAGREVARPEDP